MNREQYVEKADIIRDAYNNVIARYDSHLPVVGPLDFLSTMLEEIGVIGDRTRLDRERLLGGYAQIISAYQAKMERRINA